MSEVIKSCDNCSFSFYRECDNPEHLNNNGKYCGEWNPDNPTLQLQLQQKEKELEDKQKHIDALKEVLNEYIPYSLLDEANSKVIELTKGDVEKCCTPVGNNIQQHIDMSNQKHSKMFKKLAES
jgi:uncharacterized protein YeeX (DUF496 family)